MTRERASTVDPGHPRDGTIHREQRVKSRLACRRNRNCLRADVHSTDAKAQAVAQVLVMEVIAMVVPLLQTIVKVKQIASEEL